MIFLYWDKYFETGCQIIDNQHSEFIQISERLQKSIYSQDQSSFENSSAEFLAHLENHFNTENELMTANHYPGLFSHKAEHSRFYEKVKKDIAGLNKKSTNDINLFFEVSYRWFKNHLEINDRKLAHFLKDNNIA